MLVSRPWCDEAGRVAKSLSARERPRGAPARGPAAPVPRTASPVDEMLMKRREFIVNVCATAIWPSVALAQTKVWRIGMLDTASRELNLRNLEAFQMRLRELGYVEGSNLVVDYRSSDGRSERLSTLVTELLRLNPDVIVVRGTAEIVAVKNATTTIPIVMSAVADPVRAASLSHYRAQTATSPAWLRLDEG